MILVSPECTSTSASQWYRDCLPCVTLVGVHYRASTRLIRQVIKIRRDGMCFLATGSDEDRISIDISASAYAEGERRDGPLSLGRLLPWHNSPKNPLNSVIKQVANISNHCNPCEYRGECRGGR